MKMNEREIQVRCQDELIELESALIAGKELDGRSYNGYATWAVFVP